MALRSASLPPPASDLWPGEMAGILCSSEWPKLVETHFCAVHLAAPGLVAVTAPMALSRRDVGGLE